MELVWPPQNHAGMDGQEASLQEGLTTGGGEKDVAGGHWLAAWSQDLCHRGRSGDNGYQSFTPNLKETIFSIFPDLFS